MITHGFKHTDRRSSARAFWAAYEDAYAAERRKPAYVAAHSAWEAADSAHQAEHRAP